MAAACRPRSVVVAGLLAVALLFSVGTPAAESARQPVISSAERLNATQAPPWTQRIGVLSARELARAALERFAARLGLRRSIAGVRVVRELRVPAGTAGSSELRLLRFHQTAGGLRVVWSQIDVAVAAGKVSSIGATVVPVKASQPQGQRRVSRKQARVIAQRAVRGREHALRPTMVAYAGNPTTTRTKPRTARRAWVVQTTPLRGKRGDDSPSGVCIVVDAQTGRILARWKGSAARSLRPGGRPRASAITTLVEVWDANQSATNVPTKYAFWRTFGDPFNIEDWPSSDEAIYLRPRTELMDDMTSQAREVVGWICLFRGFCGKDGGFDGSFNLLRVVGNAPGNGSFVLPDHLDPVIGVDHSTPADSANDVLAHEFGHVMDFVYAGDRLQTPQGSEVEEGLADMFAFDYDRDPTLGEDTDDGVLRNWENPGLINGPRGGPYPALMRDYKCPPGEEHHNSTILSHAYYRFVQKIGFNRAGNVLQYVSWFMGPRPRFVDVKNGFITRSRELYPGQPSLVAAAAREAFVDEVGIGRDVPTTGPCG